MEYYNEQYDMIEEKPIEEADIESKITQSFDGFVYTEISFYGNCACEPEQGICIGFQDKQFLGIHVQDCIL